MKSDVKIHLGHRIKDGRSVDIPFRDLCTHAVLSGRTGSGKSRLLIQIIRQLIGAGIGCAVLEPGDMCADIMADHGKMVAQLGNKSVLKRLHYLVSSPTQCFRYDLFKMPVFDTHPECQDSLRRAWLHTKVQSVAEIFQSKQGTESFEGMPRLHRVISDVFFCLGVEVAGKRLSVADANILLNIHHDKHEAVFEKIRAKLPSEVVDDFVILHRMVRVEDLRRETESTLNRLRAFFGPLVQAILSATGREPSVDLYEIIQKGHCLLVPLQEDPFMSHDQKISLAALMFHDLVETLITTPRQRRKPFVIILDECGELICALGDRLHRCLAMMRKYMGDGGIILGGQDLSTFKKGDNIDYAPRVFSQCGILATFNQRWPDDLEKLAKIVFAGNFRFEKLTQEVERHTGKFEWVEVDEHSEQWNTQRRISRGTTVSEGMTLSEQESTQRGKSHGTNDTQSEQNGAGSVHTSSRPLDYDTRKVQLSDARSDTAGFGKSRGVTDTETETHGVTKGKATTTGTAESVQEGEATGQGGSISHKRVPLPEPPVRETVDTGMLKDAIADQERKFMQTLACLKPRHVVMRLPGEDEAFEMVTADVPDPFSSIEAQMKCIEWVKREQYALHPYFFTPILDEGEREKRLDEFLRQEGDDVKPDVIIENGEPVTDESGEEPAANDDVYGI